MKKVLSLFLIPALLLFVFTGCFKDPEPPVCDYDACAVKAPDTEIAAVKHYLDSLGISATQHCSGLFYTIDSTGSGKTPEACQNVGVRYKGMLTNGHVFDSSSTGIVLNLGGVIRGWTNGVPLLKEGGKITLYIPPSLGYGNRDQKDQNGNVVIPANSITIFNVDLVVVY
jgi:FKBP-type peptidyl-prolyl cis-trans isomerase FkpA